MNVNLIIEILDKKLEYRVSTTIPEETPEGYIEVPANQYELKVKVRVKVESFIPILPKGKLYLTLTTSRNKAMYDKGVYGVEEFKDYAKIKEDIDVPHEGEYELDYDFAVETGDKMPKFYVGGYAEVAYLGQSEIVWKEVIV